MRPKLRQLLTKGVEVAQARGWTAPDARLVARIEDLERRLAALEALVATQAAGGTRQP